MGISIDYDRFVETMQEQAKIGATPEGGLNRLALSDPDKAVRDWFVDQLIDEGLEIRIDAIGNVFGRRSGSHPNAAPILLGSHLDSQPNGGIYDGALGVIAALEFIRTLNDEGIKTHHPIEIVNWTNEEGSRFQPAMQGSGVWAGTHDIDIQYEKSDEEGNTLEEELERIGYKGDAPTEPQEDYESYLELHVEQGPCLENEGVDVGVVTGVVGFTWGEMNFTGESDHSGPTPMDSRSDALVAAANVISQIQRIPGMLGERTVGTVGEIKSHPNSVNIVPGETMITWGFRDPDDDIVQKAYEMVVSEAKHAAVREGVELEYSETMRSSSVEFADRCINTAQSAADELGYTSTQLISGAGHDAAHLASVTDTGMIFAISEDGKSHSPQEYTSWEDCYKAANTFSNTAYQIATNHSN